MLGALGALSVAAPAQAAPGDLDPSFGDGGKVLTDLGRPYDEGQAMTVQPDGKVLVAGNSYETTCQDEIWCSTDNRLSLARYNADGTLDSSFGTVGKQTTAFGGEGNDLSFDIALQADGKIVAVHSQGGYAAHEFALARYNTDGSLDTGFGNGGYQTTDFDLEDYGTDYGAFDVAIQPDGKIVAVGRTGNGDFGIARYNQDGSLDPGFGTGGKQKTDLGGFDYGNALVLQKDGKMVVAGMTLVGGKSDFALARYNPDGSIDSSFGTGGKLVSDFGAYASGRAVALQDDNKIVVAGNSDSDGGSFALARYTREGTLDASFSDDGYQLTDFGDLGSAATAVAIDRGGKIVSAGGYGSDFALARHEPDGSPDAGFSGDGKQTTDFGEAGRGGDDKASDLALLGDDKILAVGKGGVYGIDFALARYEGGELQDTSPPDTSITDGPSGTTSSTSASFAFASSEPGSTFECKLDGGSFEPCSSPKTHSGLTNGEHAFSVRATDAAGNTDATPASRTWTIDSAAPTVTSVTPTDGTTGVSPSANVLATFSEAMNKDTITTATVKLVQNGTTTPVAATVSYDVTAKRAVLDPSGSLKRGATYTATVTTGVKDSVGNAMAADKTWSFKVKR